MPVHFRRPSTCTFCGKWPSARWALVSRKSSLALAGCERARGDLGGGDLVEVARPDEVVRRRALVLLVDGQLAPGPRHGRRGDAGARIALVVVRGEHEQRRLVGGEHRRGRRRRGLQGRAVGGPAGRVLGGERREAGGERVAGRAPRGDLVGAEAERERELLRRHAVERRAGGLADVPAGTRVGLRVERAVVAQVHPRVAGAGVAARGGGERRRGGQRARHPAVAGDERAGDRARAVVAAVVVELAGRAAGAARTAGR